jgi:DNA polymerase-3 subunit delta'
MDVMHYNDGTCADMATAFDQDQVPLPPMSLPPLYGHEGLLTRLEAALASGRFPQALLFIGPPGAGKQRLALWVAQALLCERAPGAPCGTCPDCRQVLELAHPDLHWFVPIPRPKAGDPAKQMDEARDLLGEAIAERRSGRPYRRPDGLASHSLASVRVLQRVVGMTPFRGQRKVIVLGDAERLVVQDASPEAANALLKVLEEPPADTTLILTAAEPQALLPTIRSRLVPVRIGPVGDEVVRRFLTHEVHPAPAGGALERRVTLAEGLIGRALWMEDDGSDTAETAAQSFLTAVRSGPERWTPLVLAQAPWGARGGYGAMLDALAMTLRESLAAGVAQPDRSDLVRHLAALRRVDAARAELGSNVNPQLALAVLAHDLADLA